MSRNAKVCSACVCVCAYALLSAVRARNSTQLMRAARRRLGSARTATREDDDCEDGCEDYDCGCVLRNVSGAAVRFAPIRRPFSVAPVARVSVRFSVACARARQM